MLKFYFSLLNDKKSSKYLVLNLVHEQPYGYQVAHHVYLLIYCPGRVNLYVNNNKINYFFVNFKKINKLSNVIHTDLCL